MTAKDVIKRLREDDWYEVKQVGSHRKFRHDEKSGIVTVPMHKGEIPIGTIKSIVRQAGWDE